jgi:Flp pilus assembly pilin Flp
VAAIEYALIAALIALAIVAALTRTGTAVGSNWNEVDQAMPGGVGFQTP